jgi:hypothetical protein
MGLFQQAAKSHKDANSSSTLGLTSQSAFGSRRLIVSRESRTSSTPSSTSTRTFVSAARRKGLAAIKKFGRAAAQAASFCFRKLVHQGPVLFDGYRAVALFFAPRLLALHSFLMPSSTPQVKQPLIEKRRYKSFCELALESKLHNRRVRIDLGGLLYSHDCRAIIDGA